jgi:hypothetical protein
VPVIFRVDSGDGTLTGGVRELQVSTDGAGEARASFTAGRTAGKGLNVVTARSPGRRGSPAAFSVTVSPAALSSLAAHSPRWDAGLAGGLVPRPLAVRALDAAGNPLAGVPVEFRVVSGSARFAVGVDRVSTTTGPAGLASAALTLGAGTGADERNVIAASGPGGLSVTFNVDALVPGAPGDTRLRGAVVDLDGRPLKNLPVRCVDLPSVATVTDAAGGFDLGGLPAGLVLMEFGGGAGPGGGYAAARREVRLLVRDSKRPPRTGAAPAPRRRISHGRDPGIGGVRRQSPRWRRSPASGSRSIPVRRGSRWIAEGAGDVDRGGPRPVREPGPRLGLGRVPGAGLPEGVTFDPPARLYVPSSRRNAGQVVRLLSSPADAGGFIESGAGRVSEDRAYLESLPGQGLPSGGLAFYTLPGPAGATSAIAGRVSSVSPGGTSVDQREGSPVIGKDVYAHSGEFFLEAVDLEMRGRGMDYRFRRRYESRHAFKGSLGYNWEHEYADRRIEQAPGSSNLLRADGRGRFDEYLATAAGEYVSPIGVFTRLYQDAGGFLVEREADGTRYLYHALDGSALSGRLMEISDRASNRIRIERDEGGRIARVIDTWAGSSSTRTTRRTGSSRSRTSPGAWSISPTTGAAT